MDTTGSQGKATGATTGFSTGDINMGFTKAQGEAEGVAADLATGDGVKHSSLFVGKDCNVPDALIEQELATPRKWLLLSC